MAPGIAIDQTLHRLLAEMNRAQGQYRAQSVLSLSPMAVVLLGTVAATHLVHAREIARAMRTRGIALKPDPATRARAPVCHDDPVASTLARERAVIAAYDAALNRIRGLDIGLATQLSRQRARLATQLDELGPVPAI